MHKTCWSTLRGKAGHCLAKPLVNCRSTAGQPLANRWSTTGQPLVNHWSTPCQTMPVNHWSTHAVCLLVKFWSKPCWSASRLVKTTKVSCCSGATVKPAACCTPYARDQTRRSVGHLLLAPFKKPSMHGSARRGNCWTIKDKISMYVCNVVSNQERGSLCRPGERKECSCLGQLFERWRYMTDDALGSHLVSACTAATQLWCARCSSKIQAPTYSSHTELLAQPLMQPLLTQQ